MKHFEPYFPIYAFFNALDKAVRPAFFAKLEGHCIIITKPVCSYAAAIG